MASFGTQLVASFGFVAVVTVAVGLRPLAAFIFALSFLACLIMFGFAFIGPSLVLFVPILWIVSVKIANFIMGRIDAFFEGCERLAGAVVRTVTSAAWYVVTHPLSTLLFIASWYVFPYKCFWTCLVVAPAMYCACVKVALRVGSLRRPAKECAIRVGSGACNVTRAVWRAGARVVQSRTRCGGGGAAAAVGAKAKNVAEAVRRQARRISLRDVHSHYITFAYAFDLAYLELAIYVAWKYYALLSNDVYKPPHSERIPFLASHMWDNLLFLLKNPSNRKIVASLTAVNLALFALVRVAKDNDFCEKVKGKVSSMYECIPPLAPTALNLAGSVKSYLTNCLARAARSATAFFNRAKNLVFHSMLMVRRIPVYVSVVSIIALSCACRPDAMESAISKVSQLAESAVAQSSVQDLGDKIGNIVAVPTELLFRAATSLRDNSTSVIGAAVVLFALAGMHLAIRFLRAGRRSKSTKPKFGSNRRVNKKSKSLVLLFVALSVTAGIACWGNAKLDGVPSVLPPIIQPDAEVEAHPTTSFVEPISLPEGAQNATPQDVHSTAASSSNSLNFFRATHDSMLGAFHVGVERAVSGLSNVPTPTYIAALVVERSPPSVRSALHRYLPARAEPLTNAELGRGPPTEYAVHELEQAQCANKMRVFNTGCSCIADLARSVPYQRMIAEFQSSVTAIKNYAHESVAVASHAVIERSPLSLRPTLQRYLPARTEPLNITNAELGRGPHSKQSALPIRIIDRLGAMMGIDEKYIFVAKAVYQVASYVVTSTLRATMDMIVTALSPAPVPPPPTPCQEFALGVQDGMVKIYQMFFPPPPPPPPPVPFRDVCVAKVSEFFAAYAPPSVTSALEWSINMVGPTFSLAPVDLALPAIQGEVGLPPPPDVSVPVTTTTVSTIKNLTDRAMQQGLRVAVSARRWIPVDC